MVGGHHYGPEDPKPTFRGPLLRVHPVLTTGALLLAAVCGSLGAYGPLLYTQLKFRGELGWGQPSLAGALFCPGGGGLLLSVLAAFWTGQIVFDIVQAKDWQDRSRLWLLLGFGASILSTTAASLVLGILFLGVIAP